MGTQQIEGGRRNRAGGMTAEEEHAFMAGLVRQLMAQLRARLAAEDAARELARDQQAAGLPSEQSAAD